MQQRQMSALALSPIKREIADSGARANRPEGNYQCRRWYDLFAATPEAHSVVPVYCTRRHSISSPDQLNFLRARMAPVLRSDAVNAM
jgi:hypothetical protein